MSGLGEGDTSILQEIAASEVLHAEITRAFRPQDGRVVVA